jgi:hypothetical protein
MTDVKVTFLPLHQKSSKNHIVKSEGSSPPIGSRFSSSGLGSKKLQQLTALALCHLSLSLVFL